MSNKDFTVVPVEIPNMVPAPKETAFDHWCNSYIQDGTKIEYRLVAPSGLDLGRYSTKSEAIKNISRYAIKTFKKEYLAAIKNHKAYLIKLKKEHIQFLKLIEKRSKTVWGKFGSISNDSR